MTENESPQTEQVLATLLDVLHGSESGTAARDRHYKNFSYVFALT